MLAITHLPSPHLDDAVRTHVAHSVIDVDLAARQHQAYCNLLERCGAQVCTLNVNMQLPDCAFVEDAAVVLDEVAVLASMGTASRREEPAGILPTLQQHREVLRIEPSATLEGGDVLRVGKTLLVGCSSRTNREGTAALESLVQQFGYRVVPVPVRGCLHLKTACCALPDGRLLVNRAWLDMQPLRDFECIDVPVEEPWGANFLTIGNNVILQQSHRRTAEALRKFGCEVHAIDLSEFAKAEAGVTCLSLLVP